MNKIFKYSMLFAAALTFTMSFTSCDNDDNNDHVGTFGESTLKEVNASYVENTIVATYRNLADYNKQLVADLNAMSNDAGVKKACETWRQSRKWWEFSEVMSVKHALYGGCTVDGTTPNAKSLIGICLNNSKTKAAAENVMTNLENALSKIAGMSRHTPTVKPQLPSTMRAYRSTSRLASRSSRKTTTPLTMRLLAWAPFTCAAICAPLHLCHEPRTNPRRSRC